MNGDQPKMNFVSKGWGFERWIVNKKEYCGKLLFIAKDRKCSLHYHKLKDETFYLQSGKIKLYYSDNIQNIKELSKKKYYNIHDALDSIILNPGDNFYIPQNRVHQIIALQDSELFEFSTEHKDSDSYRLIKGN